MRCRGSNISSQKLCHVKQLTRWRQGHRAETQQEPLQGTRTPVTDLLHSDHIHSISSRIPTIICSKSESTPASTIVRQEPHVAVQGRHHRCTLSAFFLVSLAFLGPIKLTVAISHQIFLHEYLAHLFSILKNKMIQFGFINLWHAQKHSGNYVTFISQYLTIQCFHF